MKNKKILSLIVAAVMTLGITGCANKGGEGDTNSKSGAKINYVIPSSWANNKGLTKIIESYEKKSGNKIEVQGIPDEQYNSVVASRLESGEGIDIFFGANKLFDVENVLVEISGENFESRVNPIGLETLKYTNGKIYGFATPQSLNSFGVFYNKDAFKKVGVEVPKTLDEFNSIASKLKQNGTTPIVFSGKDGWTLLQHRNAVNGTVTLSDKSAWDKLNKNEIAFGDVKEYKEEYAALEHWVKEGFINEQVLTTSYEQAQEMLAKGDAAMMVQGTWVVGAILGTHKDANLGFFPLPTKDGSIVIPLSGFDGGAHIAKKSKVVEESKDFLRYMIEPEQVKIYLEDAPGISAYSDVDLGDLLPEALKDVQKYVTDGKTSIHGDSIYVVPTPEQDVIASYQELIVGKKNADEFLKTIDNAFKSNGATAGIKGFN